MKKYLKINRLALYVLFIIISFSSLAIYAYSCEWLESESETYYLIGLYYQAAKDAALRAGDTAGAAYLAQLIADGDFYTSQLQETWLSQGCGGNNQGCIEWGCAQ